MVELIVFIVFAIAAVAGGLAMVTARNPIFSALGLLLAMLSVAVFYLLLDAPFLAAVQVLIYAGAVMTLFLFVIMLIGVDRSEKLEERIPLQRPLAIILAVGIFALVVAAGLQAWVTGTTIGVIEVSGTVQNIADKLFGTWTLAFLSTVFLLTIAAVGTIALAQFGPMGLSGAQAETNADADEFEEVT